MSKKSSPATVLLSWILLAPVLALGYHLSFPGKPLRHGPVMMDASLKARGDVIRNAPATNYDITTGPVACGGYHQPSEFVVSMNKDMFQGSCGKTITISYQGKTAQATVVDECIGCADPAYGGSYGGIDLTNGLFLHFFPDLGKGRIYVDWFWGTEQAPPPPPPPKTTTTSTTHKPTSTSTTSTSTTTSTTSTSTSTSSTSTTSSLSSTSSSSTATSSTDAAEPTFSLSSSVISNLYQAVLGLGDAVVAGTELQIKTF